MVQINLQAKKVRQSLNFSLSVVQSVFPAHVALNTAANADDLRRGYRNNQKKTIALQIPTTRVVIHHPNLTTLLIRRRNVSLCFKST